MTYYHTQEVTSSWALVVEEKTVAGKYAVSLSVVDDNPVGVELSSTWDGGREGERERGRAGRRDGGREGGREEGGVMKGGREREGGTKKEKRRREG